MQPRVDISKPQPKPNVDASDQDRVASSIERPPDPKNSLPFARGNSPEKVEAEVAAGKRGQCRESADAAPASQERRPKGRWRPTIRRVDAAAAGMPAATPALQHRAVRCHQRPLGDALRNLQRYTQQQSFDNPQGSGDAQGLIQFDSKGVEFGPWLRRFVAQVKRNWFIPSAAMMMKGHVVITFNVHRTARSRTSK